MKFIVKFTKDPSAYMLTDGPNTTTVWDRVKKYRSDCTVFSTKETVFSWDTIPTRQISEDDLKGDFCNTRKTYFFYSGTKEQPILLAEIQCLDSELNKELHARFGKGCSLVTLRGIQYILEKKKGKTQPIAYLSWRKLETKETKEPVLQLESSSVVVDV